MRIRDAAIAPTRWARQAPAFLLLSIIATGCESADGRAPVEETAIPVRVATVQPDSLAPVIEAAGVLGPRQQVDLAFKIGGVVAQVLVDEGMEVARGARLAVLDPVEINAQVAKAKSALDKAERDLTRAKNLYRDSVATLEQVQNAQTAADVARSDYEAAAFNQRHALIVAPSDGIVLRRSVEAGELVAPGQPVVVFGSRSAGSVVRVALTDRDLVNVQAGDPAEVSFDAYPGRTFAGRVQRVGAAANLQTGTYTIEVAVPEVPSRVAGLIGRVRIQPSTSQSVLMVPIDAITEANRGAAVVFAVSDDGTTAQQYNVTLGRIEGAHVAVLSGLERGTRVITAGAPYLTDGARVKVVQ